MSAQYRPYRDEESVDGLETTSWTDAEPGSIQIYEKTTEELPMASNKRALRIQIALCTLAALLGFLLGFYAHLHPHGFISDLEEEGRTAKHLSDLFEDPEIKDKLLDQIDGLNILQTLNKFKDIDRTPGSDGDHKFAAYVESNFKEFGLEPVRALPYTFKTMLPRQGSIIRILDKDNKTIFSTNDNFKPTPQTPEPVVPYLPLSQAEETIITTNQLLYINKGLKEDYAKLSELGLHSNETRGKVFVIRQTYYQAHDIVINAQDSGAQAVILFPDPDTYGSGSPFPKSVQLPDDAARSHPLAWSNYGDLASLNLSLANNIDVAKLGLEKESKVRIPVLLVSYQTARMLLIGLSGSVVPNDWNCFDVTLHLGPGYKEENTFDARSKIRIEFYNHETTLTTTTITGIIAGSVEPDRYVVIGSRRDSLNRGLLDSISGSAVMLEIARVYGSLVKRGWRPRRTIMFNSFGAESLNLIGSSNWLETHQRLLHSRAVSYINCDLVVTGNQSVTIAASPLLYQVLYNATKQVKNPNESSLQRTVYEAWRDTYHRSKSGDSTEASRSTTIRDLDKIISDDKFKSSSAKADSDEDSDSLGHQGDMLHEFKKSATIISRPRVRRLDLQSIYSPFFLYAGIPVVDVRYTGFRDTTNKSTLLEDTLPLIGTKYDNMQALQLIDPHLKYHIAVGQVLAEILRDLSDSIYLPFNLLDYAVTLEDSFAHLKQHYGETFEKSSLELGKCLDGLTSHCYPSRI